MGCAGRPAIMRRDRCTAGTASSTTRRSRPRRSCGRPVSGSRSSTSTTTMATARQQIFWTRGDVRYVSIHADPDRAYPYFLGRADEIGEGAGAGENLNIPLRGGATNADYLAAADRALEAILAVPGSVIVVSLGFDTYGLDPIGDFALTTGGLSRGRSADGRDRPSPRHPAGRRLPPAVARRERAGLAARRRGPRLRSAAVGRVRGAWRRCRMTHGCGRDPATAWPRRSLTDWRRRRRARGPGPRPRGHRRPVRTAAALGPRARALPRCSTSSSSSRCRSPRRARRSIASARPPTR